MPSAIVKTIFFDLDKLAWTITAGGNALLQPLTIGQNDTIDFNVQFIKSGAAQTLTSPTFSAGIKVLNGFSDAFVVQFGAPTGTPPTYTFTATISSTELSAALLTGVQFAIEFRDSTNGIVTLPALTLNIVASYTITGTTPTSANGTLSVAAGKTVTFPQSLTFPAAAGTNGFQLTTDGAGALTWAASGSSGITIGATTANGTAGRVLYTDGSLVQAYAISGTGSVAMTGSPAFTTPILGAATATSINAATGTLTLGVQTINLAAGNSGTGAAGGSINLSGVGPTIDANYGGSINLSGGGDSENSNGGSINLSGGLGAICPGGSINLSGGVNYGGGSINMSGGATYPGGSITTTAGGSITTGVGSLTFTGAGAATFALGAGTQTYTFPTTTATLARTDAAQTFTGVQTVTGGMVINPPAGAGVDNIFIGTAAGMAGKGALTTGAYNTLIGRDCGKLITSGAGNMCIGAGAGERITTGSNNMAVGTSALSNVAGNSNCVAIGYQALVSQTLGNNIGIGSNAGLNATGGQRNTFIGADVVATGVATGNYNTVIGSQSGSALTSGTNNVIIGDQAGTALTTGANNSSLGSSTAFSAVGATYQTAIGSGATCTANNQVMLGTATGTVTLPGGLVPVPIAQTASTAAVSVAVTTTALTTTGVAQAITLANGTNGQIKIITHIANGGTGTAVLTPDTSAADYNTITFSSVGDTATLQYHTTGGWYILSLRGAVAA